MAKLFNPLNYIFSKLEANKPFSEPEAWRLFRWFALAEAVGWTILIGGILINRYHLPGASGAIQVAGQIHGMIFLTYFAIALVCSGSLRWSRKQLIASLLFGVPPYGTLLFELWTSHQRHRNLARIRYCNALLTVLAT